MRHHRETQDSHFCWPLLVSKTCSKIESRLSRLLIQTMPGRAFKCSCSDRLSNASARTETILSRLDFSALAELFAYRNSKPIPDLLFGLFSPVEESQTNHPLSGLAARQGYYGALSSAQPSAEFKSFMSSRLFQTVLLLKQLPFPYNYCESVIKLENGRKPQHVLERLPSMRGAMSSKCLGHPELYSPKKLPGLLGVPLFDR
jgi:hypothetical protein